MSDTDPIQQTLQVMIAQIEDDMRATADKKKAANELCRLLNQSAVYPDVGYANSVTTLPDEYYGRQMPT